MLLPLTDLIDAPVQSLVYGALTPLVYPLPLPVKTGLLLAGSMYHMRHDILGVALMHLAWVNHTYLACMYRDIISEVFGYKSKKGSDCSQS